MAGLTILPKGASSEPDVDRNKVSGNQLQGGIERVRVGKVLDRETASRFRQ